MELTLHATGPAPADVVWDRYVRPALWSTWSPQIRGVVVNGVPAPIDLIIAPGLTGRVRGPLGVSVGFVVQDVQPGADSEGTRTWRWRARIGPLALTLRHEVTPEGPGTRTDLVVDGPPPAVLGYLPLAQLALHRLVKR